MNDMNTKGKIRGRGSFSRQSFSDRAFDAVNWTIMILICVSVAYPLWFVLVASFTDPNVVNQGRILLYPVKLFLGGYERIFRYPPLWKGYLNTLIYTAAGSAVSIAVTVPAAYSLSRRDMAGRRIIMFLFTFTMFFSGGIIPLYLIIQKIHIYNTLWAMVLPGAVSVYNLIVCRSFFDTSIPQELLEASRLDGCTDFGFFFKIALPLSSTIIAVMVLFYATGIWNAFMNALMFMADQGKMPLQVIMRNLILINQANMITTDASEMIMRQKLAEQLKYGVIVVSALPLLLAYPFLQKYFVRGVMIGAVKG
ncbi:MAG: carbohydrate ABC transporter permease [Treponema sp.]|jgi:putative aldouronate transport system permease protein|nr:carbohydrate ABC transporter permease [Treponema sp.]